MKFNVVILLLSFSLSLPPPPPLPPLSVKPSTALPIVLPAKPPALSLSDILFYKGYNDLISVYEILKIQLKMVFGYAKCAEHR